MSLRERTRRPIGHIPPCLPSRANRPPSGPEWLHDIKHDGVRIMARRNDSGVRLYTRNGYDFAARFPPIVEAVSKLKVRCCFIDAEPS
jgi:bifunctional non-homologous end joining protein LigD